MPLYRHLVAAALATLVVACGSTQADTSDLAPDGNADTVSTADASECVCRFPDYWDGKSDYDHPTGPCNCPDLHCGRTYCEQYAMLTLDCLDGKWTASVMWDLWCDPDGGGAAGDGSTATDGGDGSDAVVEDAAVDAPIDSDECVCKFPESWSGASSDLPTGPCNCPNLYCHRTYCEANAALEYQCSNGEWKSGVEWDVACTPDGGDAGGAPDSSPSDAPVTDGAECVCKFPDHWTGGTDLPTGPCNCPNLFCHRVYCEAQAALEYSCFAGQWVGGVEWDLYCTPDAATEGGAEE